MINKQTNEPLPWAIRHPRQSSRQVPQRRGARVPGSQSIIPVMLGEGALEGFQLDACKSRPALLIF